MNSERMSRAAGGFLLLWIAAVMVACGGLVDAAGAPYVRDVGKHGGTVERDGASVKIPEGALDGATTIEVQVATDAPAGYVGTAYRYLPEGLIFAVPVTVRLSFDTNALPEGTDATLLRLATVVNGAWQEVAGSVVDVASGHVQAPVSHFSTYAVWMPCYAAGSCFVGAWDDATGCVYTPRSCDDGDDCTADSCAAATGLCEHAALNECQPLCVEGVDFDQDGSPCDEDCNDNDAAVHPGATEACFDGVDADCDGLDNGPTCPGCTAVPRDGLFGEWVFTGDVKDSSGRGLDLQDHGTTPAADRFGVEGTARLLDGASYLASSASAGLGSGGKTMSVWVYVDATMGDLQTILTTGTRSDRELFALGAVDGGFWVSQHGDGISATMDVTARWIHLATTVDDTGFYRLYVNGVLKAWGSVPTSFIDGPVVVGSTGDGAQYFRGRIDDIRIYDRALSSDGIVALHQECQSPCTASPVDADGDGYASVATCGEDCDDGNAAVHPGLIETCFDGVDQDCDGATDNGPACLPCQYVEAAGAGYYFCSQPVVWSQAEAYCEGYGMHLLVIDSAAEYDALFQAWQGSPLPLGWFGLTDAAEEGVWKTWDGQDAPWFRWAENQPDNAGDEDCVQPVADGDWVWNDVPCLNPAPFWCELCAPGADHDGDGALCPDDCNDVDATVHPEATETCFDGVDSDCDGQDNGPACPACPVVPRDALFGEWLFAGDLRDTSGRGLDMEDHGSAAAEDRFGVAGSARRFDGSAYMTTAVNSGLGKGGKTLSAWLHRDPGEWNLVETVLATGVPSDWTGFEIGLRSDVGPGYWTGQHNVSVDYGHLEYSTWTHLAATVSLDGVYRLFVNGTLRGERSLPTDFKDAPVVIGWANDGSPMFFHGLIDDARIYDRALSGPEVLALFNECGAEATFAALDQAVTREAQLARSPRTVTNQVASATQKLGADSRYEIAAKVGR